MIVIILASLLLHASADNLHRSKRAQLLQDEALMSVGGRIQLTDDESRVNDCLMKHKFHELDYAFYNPQFFNFSQHYFTYKDKIKYSKVYQIIRDMPKGAALHVHDMAIMDPDYLLNITYMDHLYVCFDSKYVKYLFSKNVPENHCRKKWQLLSAVRKSSANITDLDAMLRQQFTMVVQNPDEVYPNIQKTWDRFLNYFGTVAPLLTYRPVWEKYFYDALEKFRNENVMYVEVRSVLPQLYELDGTQYDQLVTAKAYRKSIENFKKTHPDFLGAKLIFAPSRLVNRTVLDEYLKTAKKLKSSVPEIFAGFDLVGPEDRGGPLIEFVPQLEAAAGDLQYFFHAGETNWYGALTDENLADALLLGAKRLGHAYALNKHPLLAREAARRHVALEVNVLSNSVLSLVRDVRNHPLAGFLARGLPVVLSSDDPGAWEADLLAHDFYVAFAGVASRHHDLRLLKALATNSLLYSALDDAGKKDALRAFDAQWQHFIDNFECSRY